MVKQPYFRAISAKVLASDSAPVDVSACTNATILISGSACNACSTKTGETGSPHALSTMIAMPPQRSTFSRMRSPKTPLRQTKTLSPASTKLTKHASMPALPGADTAIVNVFLV